jgi:outer membrane protein TolC
MSESLFRKNIFFILALTLITIAPSKILTAQENLPLLTLDECVQKGLDNDPDIVRAEENLSQINNTLWTDYGSFLPSVRTSIGYNWSSRPTVAEYIENPDGPPIPVYVNDSYSSSLSIDQNLFNGFSDYFSLRANRHSKKSLEKNYDNQVLNAIYDIKAGYYEVLQTMKLADVQEKALERSQEQLRITETRYELGSAALSDVLKARVSEGEARLALINAENNYKVAIANLNYLVGMDIERQYRVDTTVTVQETDYTLENSIQTAMEQNPVLQSYKASMDASRNNVRAAWGGFLPNLNFNFSTSYYQVGEFEFGEIYSANHNYRYGLTLSLNIFDRFLTKRNVSVAKAALNTDKFNYNNFVNNLKLLVTRSYLNLERAQLAMEVSRDKLTSAQEDYKLAQERYSLGAATILDLLNAEVSLKTAESDLIDSEYNLNLAVADLERALGKIEY